MKDTCPNCGGPMKRHGTRRLDRFNESHRDCKVCSYGDRIIVEPERILLITPVVRRRTLPPTQTNQASV